jgi:hypothetical protein
MAGIRPLKNDQHLFSISLNLCQKMMFQHPKLMLVLRQFTNIEQFFHTSFLKIENERIQSRVSSTFYEICKKLDHDLPRQLMSEKAQKPTDAAAA